MVIVCIQFIGPVIILIYCYGKIVWMLTRRIDATLETNGPTSAGKSGRNNKFFTARTNTIKTMLLVAICFIICWVHDEVYYFMYNLGYDADWDGIYFKFAITMINLNCTVNPFVYLIKYQDYQKALREFFFKNTILTEDSQSSKGMRTETKKECT